MLHVPEVIRQCSGIIIFGKRIKSIAFTTDLSIVRNVNSDAIIAVYPFTPQPIITDALLMASDKPIFAGIGGGLTTGPRVVALGINAEMQGAMGVVMNSPTKNEVLKMVADALDIPAIITVVNAEDDFHLRIEAGADIFNVAAGTNTAEIVRSIRKSYPDFPIIATGGPSDETIIEAIEAGANAISWTPPPASTL
ncbi:MAG: hydrolase, partial [Oscillospiraceae bacterium]